MFETDVVIIGAGALGSPVIQYLAAAGVGTLKIVDHDTVALGNLQSQVIHSFRGIKYTGRVREPVRDTILKI